MFVPQMPSWLSFLSISPGTVKGCLLLVSWVILWFPIAWPVSQNIQWRPFEPLTATQKLPLVVSLYIIVPLLVWLTVVFEGSSVSDYGLFWTPDFLISILWGLGLAIGGLGLVFWT